MKIVIYQEPCNVASPIIAYAPEELAFPYAAIATRIADLNGKMLAPSYALSNNPAARQFNAIMRDEMVRVFGLFRSDIVGIEELFAKAEQQILLLSEGHWTVKERNQTIAFPEECPSWANACRDFEQLGEDFHLLRDEWDIFLELSGIKPATLREGAKVLELQAPLKYLPNPSQDTASICCVHQQRQYHTDQIIQYCKTYARAIRKVYRYKYCLKNTG